MAYKPKETPRAAAMKQKKADALVALQKECDADRKHNAEALERAGLKHGNPHEFGLGSAFRVVASKRMMVCGRDFVTVAFASEGYKRDTFSFHIMHISKGGYDDVDAFQYHGSQHILHAKEFDDPDKGVFWSLRKLQDCSLAEMILHLRKPSENMSREK